MFLSLACPFFFFNAPAPTEIYTLSLHDALPISVRLVAPPPPGRHRPHRGRPPHRRRRRPRRRPRSPRTPPATRSEEHTSELQSRRDLVCRLLLEKKKKYHQHSQANH